VSDLRLYDYAASCNCYKVRLVLAQLGLPYERVPVAIFNGETLTDDYGRINPARTTPVLETEHGYLPESNAILLYLATGTASRGPVRAGTGGALVDLRADRRDTDDRGAAGATCSGPRSARRARP
jgi:glutathione S-transferase